MDKNVERFWNVGTGLETLMHYIEAREEGRIGGALESTGVGLGDIVATKGRSIKL